MSPKIYDELFMSGLSNDPAFPYWIYRTEYVGVGDLQYLKVYLFNRRLDGRTLNVITFDYIGKEYRSLSFSPVSEFNDPNIVGCAVELSDYEPSEKIRVISEVVDGKIIQPSGIDARYVKTMFPKDDDYRTRKLPKYAKNHVVYPQVREQYWQCSCGRIYAPEETECWCGQTKDDIGEIIHFDVTEDRIKQYISAPIAYDLTVSFDKNIERYKQGFGRTGLDPALLEGRLDLETEQQKYTALLNEKNKKTRKRKKLLSIVIPIVVIVGIAAALTPKVIKPAVENMIAYHKAETLLEEGSYDEAVKAFQNLGDYRDSSAMVSESLYRKADKYYSEGQYDKAIQQWQTLKEYSDSKERIDTAKESWYQEAVAAESGKKYEEAVNAFKSLSALRYKDASERYKVNSYYYAVQLMENKRYKEAIDYFAVARGYEDADDRLREARYNYGCELLNSGKYEDAIKQFTNSDGFSDAAAKLLEAKYKYVLSHKSSTNSTTYTYLQELTRTNYSDSWTIYNDLYKWRISNFVANTSEKDRKSDVNSISKSRTAYFHFDVYGGEPNKSVNVTAVAYYSNGQSSTVSWEDVYDGYQLDCWYWWDYPSSAPSTTMTVTVYINGAAVGSKTISRP